MNRVCEVQYPGILHTILHSNPACALWLVVLVKLYRYVRRVPGTVRYAQKDVPPTEGYVHVSCVGCKDADRTWICTNS